MAILDFLKKQANNATKNVSSFVQRASDKYNPLDQQFIQPRIQQAQRFVQPAVNKVFNEPMPAAKPWKPLISDQYEVPAYHSQNKVLNAIGHTPQTIGNLVLGGSPQQRQEINQANERTFQVGKKYNLPTASNPFGGNLITQEMIKDKNISPEDKAALNLSNKTNLQNTAYFALDMITNPAKGPKVGKVDVPAGMSERGLVSSVKETPRISLGTKSTVAGTYTPKANTKLMGEAKALLNDGATIDFKNTKNIDQKVAATIQHAIDLDSAGKHNEAAALFNNLSEHGTELGRGVQAFNLLNKMSPEAISLSAAGKIKKYNQTAYKKIPELTGETQKQISLAVENIRNIPTGRERNIAINDLNNMVSDLIPSSVADKAIAVWKAGLLTSLRTHERNLIGNTIMQGSEIVKDIPATLVDKALSLKTGQRTLTTTLKGMKEFGSKTTRQEVADMAKYGVNLNTELSKFDTKRVNWANTPIQQALKKYTDVVFRTLGAEDKTFFNAAYARSLYDQAGAYAINAGKKGDANFIKSLVNKPTDTMLSTATSNAEYAVFRDKNKLSGLASALKNYTNKKWYTQIPAEVVAPFTGVPSSIVGKTIAYSPIGLVNGLKNATKVISGSQVPELQRLASQEIGRGVIGSGLFGIGAYLMSKGLMTGQPKDSKESDLWVAQGKQANSVMIDGKWRSINSIGPQTLVLLAGAKAMEMKTKEGGSMGEYAASLAKDQLSQTFLAGVQGPLNAITDPNRYGKSYIGNQIASVIPNIVKDTSKSLDKLQRENNNITDYVQNSIPLWRNQNTPKRDVLGNELKQEPTGIMAFVDLFNSKTPINNPVVNELVRLNLVGSNATPSKTLATQTVNGQKVKLTPEQLDKLEAASGGTMRGNLDSLVRSAGYNQLSDEAKSKQIDKVVQDAKLQAKISLLGQTPKEPAKKKVSLAKKKTTKATSKKSSGGSKKASFKTTYSGPSISQALGDAGKKVTLKYKGITGGDNGIGKAPATAKPKKRTGNL